MSYHFGRVLIRSQDRTQLDTASSSSFEIKFKESIQGKHIVRWITIPNSLYNITPTNNTFVANGTPLLLTPGRYDYLDLESELELQLDSLGGPAIPYTVVYDTITGRFRLTSSDASPVVISAGTAAAQVLGVIPNLNTTIISGTLFPNSSFIGFPLSLGIKVRESNDSGYVTGGGDFVTTPQTDIVAGVPVNRQVWVSDNKEGTLIVPLLVGEDVYNYTEYNTFPQSLFIRGSKHLHIQLMDASTNEVVDMRGGEWEMFLERVEHNVTYEKRKRRMM